MEKDKLMKDLHIAGSDTTPTIEGAWQSGHLSMRGDSYPDNAVDLFCPLIAWVTQFLRQSERALTLELTLNSLNTSSVKAMVELFDLLEVLHRKAGRVTVKWFYESSNERAADVAREFKADCSFPFLILPSIKQG